MLISALDEVKRAGGEHRTLRLYGQERNHMTASIAKMNLVLHGVEDFVIAHGDTLERPAFTDRDRLRTFDVVLANPPYSIKQWRRDAWQSDPWGRNLLGTPPQGRADYAFFQHILASLDARTGRCAILFPHGVLFRKEEAEMRAKLVQADLVECVLGLGPNLFYNSPMEACVVVCRTQKPPERRGRILFIDAVSEVTRERYVGLEHIEPEDLRIRRWGRVAEGTTFTNLFRPGQTLFGNRRAYQRKVAVADFEGVCSGDIYVFEPQDDRLLPELLPFLCQTDDFFHHAVTTSAGSLSPRTNWTQLAQYEFALPPLAAKADWATA